MPIIYTTKDHTSVSFDGVEYLVENGACEVPAEAIPHLIGAGFTTDVPEGRKNLVDAKKDRLSKKFAEKVPAEAVINNKKTEEEAETCVELSAVEEESDKKKEGSK